MTIIDNKVWALLEAQTAVKLCDKSIIGDISKRIGFMAQL